MWPKWLIQTRQSELATERTTSLTQADSFSPIFSKRANFAESFYQFSHAMETAHDKKNGKLNASRGSCVLRRGVGNIP